MSGNLVWTNPDKETHHEALSINVPGHPARIGYFGAPGSGKRSLALNNLAAIQASKRPFNGQIVVVHLDPETDEYNILDDGAGAESFEMRGFHEEGLPDPQEFDKDFKNLLILDELPFTSFNKHQKSELDRLFNYASTHRSLTIMIMGQDAFSIPISVRRSLSHVNLWPSPIKTQNSHYGRMLGINLNDLQKRFCKSRHDCITLDMTGEGPMLRLNFDTEIRKV